MFLIFIVAHIIFAVIPRLVKMYYSLHRNSKCFTSSILQQKAKFLAVPKTPIPFHAIQNMYKTARKILEKAHTKNDAVLGFDKYVKIFRTFCIRLEFETWAILLIGMKFLQMLFKWHFSIGRWHGDEVFLFRRL